MPGLILENARLVTLAQGFGDRTPRRGDALHDLGVIERGWVSVRDGRIEDVGEGTPEPPEGNEPARIDVEGRVIMPGLVDCHTHACWAGCRFDEFDEKLAGASYLDILAAGGGIMSTVRSVREASVETLTTNLLHRIEQMARLGTTAVEVKSGYGLSTDAELKMLEAIKAAGSLIEPIIVPTFLGAHAIDPDNPDFIEQTINETLPAVAMAFPGITCDAYCEEGAWSLDACRRLFEEAQSLGCPIRVHADQFNSLGATRLAVEAGATSVDHLEASTPEDLRALAHSDTMGVLLPTSGYHLGEGYAPGRALVDLGGAVAIATNCNPGSAPTASMPFAIHLAVNRCRLTPSEAITAATWNAACVLGLQDEIGSIEVGKRADLVVLDMTDERALAWEFALPGPRMVLIGGHPHEMAPFGG
jgi:imidazolonepropionase